MGRLAKIPCSLYLIVPLVVVGLGFFVRWHLTDMRVREFVTPRATQTLGRSFAIGNINVSLLRDIRLIDFATVKSFVPNYDLLPLLQKKFAIREIDLYEPTVRASRDKTGRFNFETLTALKKDQPVKVQRRRRLVFHRQMKYKIR